MLRLKYGVCVMSIVVCKHWRDCGVQGGGCCAIGAYKVPSYGVCILACKQYEGPARPNAAEWRELHRSILPTQTVTVEGKQRDRVVLATPQRSRGLGDTIAKATKAVGIQPCAGCKRRIGWLNRKVPYKRS